MNLCVTQAAVFDSSPSPPPPPLLPAAEDAEREEEEGPSPSPRLRPAAGGLHVAHQHLLRRRQLLPLSPHISSFVALCSLADNQ